MHLSALHHIGGPPVLRLIAPGVGLNIGSYGKAASFDGVYTLGWEYNTPYVGKLWSAPKIIRRVRAYSSSSGWDHASQGAIVGFTLQGSDNTTDGLDGTWADLFSTTRADVWGAQDILDAPSGIDVSRAYLAHRLYLRCTNYDGVSSGMLAFSVAELEFYEYSYI